MSKHDANEKDKDTRLFRESMDGVKPLAQNKIDPDSAPPARKAKRPLTPHKQPARYAELDYAPSVAVDEILSFARSGVQQKLLSNLKKGRIEIEGKIDLHGCSVNEAGARLQQSLALSVAAGRRCLLVVHGRGKGSLGNKPAIKTHVNHWLRESPEVLAFHSAQAYHGGTGALYVLLKRKREDSAR